MTKLLITSRNTTTIMASVRSTIRMNIVRTKRNKRKKFLWPLRYFFLLIQFFLDCVQFLFYFNNKQIYVEMILIFFLLIWICFSTILFTRSMLVFTRTRRSTWTLASPTSTFTRSVAVLCVKWATPPKWRTRTANRSAWAATCVNSTSTRPKRCTMRRTSPVRRRTKRVARRVSLTWNTASAMLLVILIASWGGRACILLQLSFHIQYL